MLLALVAVAGIGLVVLIALGVDIRAVLSRGLAFLHAAGPWAFFAGMALLPSLAVPLLAFALSAGPAFGEELGMPTVVALSLLCVTINLLLSYWLARWALRPLLTALLDKLGYKLPEVDATDATDLLIILRVTPGIPFFAQNYLAGLANVPLVRYLLISCPIAWAFNGAFILFGNALLHGQGRVLLISIGALAALTAGTHLVRRHYSARRKPV